MPGACASAAPRLSPLLSCLPRRSAGAAAGAGASASGLPRGCQTWKPARTCSRMCDTSLTASRMSSHHQSLLVRCARVGDALITMRLPKHSAEVAWKYH